jgi:hypothetical protein
MTSQPGSVPDNARVSQLDITEHEDDDQRLGPKDWIATRPINARLTDAASASLGVPPRGASDDVVYAVASEMSRVRQAIFRPPTRDGVYCPICHRANTQISRLGTPCPTCARPLLQFGWD